MDTHELERRLAEEGCNSSYYSIGYCGGAHDAYCIAQDRKGWRVFYSERGRDQPPIFEAQSEDEACQFFFRHIMSLRHEHCVGFFRSENDANALCAKLEQHGLHPRQDRIPYRGVDDRRYRVFVTGKAIFKAKEVLGTVPARDRES